MRPAHQAREVASPARFNSNASTRFNEARASSTGSTGTTGAEAEGGSGFNEARASSTGSTGAAGRGGDADPRLQ